LVDAENVGVKKNQKKKEREKKKKKNRLQFCVN
jgi:hypothetical protein